MNGFLPNPPIKLTVEPQKEYKKIPKGLSFRIFKGRGFC